MNKWFLKSKVRAFTYLVSALSGSLFGLSACTKSAGDAATGSSGSDLTISGGFSSVSLSSVNPQQGGSFVGALAASDYKVICAIMVDPFTTGNSSVDADSTFSVTIPGGAGQPIGCMMVKAGALVASFEFAAASTGMTGATGGDGLSVNSGTTAIQLPKDLSINGAKISVPSNGVTQNSNTAPSVSWVDPTGTWNIAAACMTEINSEGVPSKNCMAPGHDSEIPSSVYLKQIEATNGTDTKKGMSVWSSAAARNSCGDKEGINLEPGWTAIGGWAGAMTGVLPIDLHDDAGLLALSSKAKVKIRGGATVCNKTTASSAPIVDGTTTCNSVDWGTGDWGMSAKACELYCVINALSEGDHANSNFDWTGYACKKRYRVNWEMIRELSSDVNYGRPGSSPVAGVFSSGHCSDTSFDGCKDTTSSKVLFKMDRALDQFMIGELFINGNVGSLMEQEHFSSNFPNEARNDIISCSGTHINKMNITETSATTATVIVENKFVPDPANPPACATNSNFLENANHDSSMALKLEK